MSQIQTLAIKNLHVDTLNCQLETYSVHDLPNELARCCTTHHLTGESAVPKKIFFPHKTHGEMIFVRNDSNTSVQLMQDGITYMIEADNGCAFFGDRLTWRKLFGDPGVLTMFPPPAQGNKSSGKK